jgi:hypothetical protein
MARSEIEIFEPTPGELSDRARSERLREAGIRPAIRPGPAAEFEPIRNRPWLARLHRLLRPFRQP